ncbi:MAG: patatin-like phospholipase family protein, partial [Saprospiraceae bacterium]|nr:patatin-like phospholipase family protein [Saprospiraceae bacterium]
MKTQLFFLLLFFVTSCANNENATTATSESASVKKTIILAVDGGGIKGIIPAIILDSIEAKTGKPCYQLFDIIGGTSTGGIIAMGLTTPQPNTNQPFPASKIIQIYENDGANIFVYQGAGIKQNYAKYYASHKDKGIEPYLQKMLGSSLALTDAFKATAKLPGSRIRQAFTTSYIVNSSGNAVQSPQAGKDYGPYLFNWYDAARNQSDNYYVWEATRGTSAAPTYFPIANVGGGKAPRSAAAEKWAIDGGMMSNDPAVWGITEAFRTGIAQDLKDIIVISIGTGMYPGMAGIGIH